MGGRHGVRGGVEQEAGFAAGPGAFEDRLDQRAAGAGSAGLGTDPEALDFPGIGEFRKGKRAPGDQADPRMNGMMSKEHAGGSDRRDVAGRKRRGFLFECAEAETGDSPLGCDETAVLQQQLAGSFHGFWWRSQGQLDEGETAWMGAVSSEGMMS